MLREYDRAGRFGPTQRSPRECDPQGPRAVRPACVEDVVLERPLPTTGLHKGCILSLAIRDTVRAWFGRTAGRKNRVRRSADSEAVLGTQLHISCIDELRTRLLLPRSPVFPVVHGARLKSRHV
jgi:hypothetical protein